MDATLHPNKPCFFCGKPTAQEGAAVKVALHDAHLREFRAVAVPQCLECKAKHRKPMVFFWVAVMPYSVLFLTLTLWIFADLTKDLQWWWRLLLLVFVQGSFVLCPGLGFPLAWWADICFVNIRPKDIKRKEESREYVDVKTLVDNGWQYGPLRARSPKPKSARFGRKLVTCPECGSTLGTEEDIRAMVARNMGGIKGMFKPGPDIRVGTFTTDCPSCHRRIPLSV